MSRHLARIVRIEPEGSPLRLIAWHLPRGATPLGYIRRGDDDGRLLRLASGSLVIQLPGGSIGTLDQRKAQALLDGDQPPGRSR